MGTPKKPNSRRNLDKAIERLASATMDPLRLRTALANAVVGQMLPEGVVKGGSALKMRYGDGTTRFTRDLDTARIAGEDSYVEKLRSSLKVGWEGFTGTLVRKDPPRPEGIPGEYVMRPYEVRLNYNEKPWCSVPLEIGHNEVGDAEDPDWDISQDIVKAFIELGFPEPAPIPLMRIEHQIAQKLHAVSCPGSMRAHDLVDLQLIAGRERVDFSATREVCQRLFAYRRQQAWPPTIEKGDEWEELYLAQSEGLDVLPSVDGAIGWANQLIARIDGA